MSSYPKYYEEEHVRSKARLLYGSQYILFLLCALSVRGDYMTVQPDSLLKYYHHRDLASVLFMAAPSSWKSSKSSSDENRNVLLAKRLATSRLQRIIP